MRKKLTNQQLIDRVSKQIELMERPDCTWQDNEALDLLKEILEDLKNAKV
jgi:hypothetical protein